jgi:hypothetical protein
MVGIQDIPIAVIANWPVANYENPDTRSIAYIIVNNVFVVVAAVFVLFRLYTRIIIRPWFGYDDIFVVLALVSWRVPSCQLGRQTSAINICPFRAQ